MTKVTVAIDNDLSRERPVEPSRTALLVVDVQYGFAKVGEGQYKAIDAVSLPEELFYYFTRISNPIIPNIQRLQHASRESGAEVMFTNIESLTLDGRERGLDYKITGFLIPKGSKEAQTLEAIKPINDEIVIPKSSSSVFNSTNIQYLLRGLKIDYLIIVGLLTDQCVESAVRDACDLGFLVTLVEDACGTFSEERHKNSLAALKGYCRIKKTDELLNELVSCS